MGKSVLLSAVVMLAMTAAAHAQNRTPAPASLPGASQTTVAPYVPQSPDLGVDEMRPLFSIGRLPVLIWTPVEQAYSSRMNRNAAANPLWQVDGF